MADTNWLSIYTYLMPILAGVSTLTVFVRSLMFWQKERTPRTFCHLVAYVSLAILFIFFSLVARMTPLIGQEIFLPVMTACYLLLALSLLGSNWYEWRELAVFLRAKNATYLAQHKLDNTMELSDAAKQGAILEATEEKKP